MIQLSEVDKVLGIINCVIAVSQYGYSYFSLACYIIFVIGQSADKIPIRSVIVDSVIHYRWQNVNTAHFCPLQVINTVNGSNVSSLNVSDGSQAVGVTRKQKRSE